MNTCMNIDIKTVRRHRRRATKKRFHNILDAIWFVVFVTVNTAISAGMFWAYRKGYFHQALEVVSEWF